MDSKGRTTFALAAVCITTAMHAAAQPFPTQPIRVLIGLPAGTSPDVVARTLGAAMGPLLGQPVIVENRPGAGGTLATSATATAAPDGHVLNASGCSGDSITHAFVSQGRPPLALFKDLTPVGRMMRDHWLVLVTGNSPVTSLKALAAFARSQPNPVAYPSQGEGSSPHLQGARLARALGFEALHVPYNDGAMNDLIGGRLAYAVQGSAAAVPLIASGRLRALAVLSSERLPALPEVPTAEQAGLKGHVFNGGICLWAPGRTPGSTQARLNAALADASRDPAVRARFDTLGVEPMTSDLEETVRFVTAFAAASDQWRTEVFGPGR
ncbi:MAG: tripartite tricarboxylate transporter substrate binding protein [Rhodocyclaceae bacterium]|nr:tripartite tricarboxylate transporter substrate binding protein [Rhodocyclaceae bacterium]